MKLQGILGVSATLAISTAACGADYRVMDLNRETLEIIDAQTIRRDASVASVWLFTQYWQGQPFADKPPLTQVKSLMEIDCVANRWRTRAVRFFADPETPLPSPEDNPTTWKYIIPDSWTTNIRLAVCEGTFNSMGALDWHDYGSMIEAHRQIAQQRYSSPK